jgi:hypothetical protein
LAVVGIKVPVAAAWEMCSRILYMDAAVVSACRVFSVMKSKDRATADLAKNVAEGSDKHVHGQRR